MNIPNVFLLDSFLVSLCSSSPVKRVLIFSLSPLSSALRILKVKNSFHLQSQEPGLSPVAKPPARYVHHNLCDRFIVTVDISLVFYIFLNKLWAKIMSIKKWKTLHCTLGFIQVCSNHLLDTTSLSHHSKAWS